MEIYVKIALISFLSFSGF